MSKENPNELERKLAAAGIGESPLQPAIDFTEQTGLNSLLLGPSTFGTGGVAAGVASKLTLRTALRQGTKTTIGLAHKALAKPSKKTLFKLAGTAFGIGLLATWFGSDNVPFIAGQMARGARSDFEKGIITKEEAEERMLVAENVLNKGGSVAENIPLFGEGVKAARLELAAERERLNFAVEGKGEDLFLKEPTLAPEEAAARKLDPESFDVLQNKTTGAPPVGQDTQVAAVGEFTPKQFAEQRKDLRRRKEAEVAFTETRPVGGIAPNKRLEDFGVPKAPKPTTRETVAGTPKTPETPIKKEKGGGPPGGFTPIPPFEAAKAEAERKKRRRAP